MAVDSMLFAGVPKDEEVLLWGMDVGTVAFAPPSERRDSNLRWKSGVFVDGFGLVGGA